LAAITAVELAKDDAALARALLPAPANADAVDPLQPSANVAA
jgi:hypothetical protein